MPCVLCDLVRRHGSIILTFGGERGGRGRGRGERGGGGGGGGEGEGRGGGEGEGEGEGRGGEGRGRGRGGEGVLTCNQAYYGEIAVPACGYHCLMKDYACINAINILNTLL